MYPKALLIFAIAIGFATSQNIDQDDYPASCSAPCDRVRTASDRCDDRFNNDNQGQQNCFCNTTNMRSWLPECVACVASQGNVENYDDGREDINQLLQACGFPTTTVLGVTPVTGSTVYTTTRTSTEDDGEVDTDTDEVTSFLSGTAGNASPTQTVVTTTSDGETTVVTSSVSPSSAGNSAQSDASSSSPNAALVTRAPLIGAVAGVMVAVGVL